MVLAAGVGERMRPLTDRAPKPLLPVANRPVMGYVLEHLARHGFTEVIANLHYRARDIEAHFRDGGQYGVSLSYSHEEELLGSAGGLKRCQETFSEEDFLVTGADDLTDMNLTAMLAAHRAAGAIASIGLVEVAETSEYGIVVTDEAGRIQHFVEKPTGPAPSNTANTQIYLFRQEIFSFIPEAGFYDFGKQVFPALVAAGLPFYGFRLEGYWRDIGSVKDYLAAQWDVLEGRLDATRPGEELSPGLRVGDGGSLSPRAKLVPPVLVGDRCTVGQEAVLGPKVVLGNDVAVGAGARLSDCVVWEGVAVPAGAEHAHAVITPEE